MSIPVCIIKPGWGSSAYYSAEMIKESGPQVFLKGTQMFVNHDTEGQQDERPEGDYYRLAGVLERDAYWDDNGPKGAALYSNAYVFSDHAAMVKEKGPHTGLSIDAYITDEVGEASGRQGRTPSAFVYAHSIDFVTRAGAGGSPIIPVTESGQGTPPPRESTMPFTQEQYDALLRERDAAVAKEAAAAAKVVAMEAQQNKIVAMATVNRLLKEAGITPKASLLDRVCESPKMVDGKVDAEWAQAVATDLAEVSEGGGGQIVGMGERRTTEAAADVTKSKRLKEAMRTLGVPDAGLEVATLNW